MRLVIVGAGAAGLAAARGYRAAGGDGAVELLTPELVLPYRRPPLSKEFLREEIGDEDLPLERDAWYENHGVTVRRGVEAERLVPQAKTILLGNGATLAYDACVLATGAEPTILPIPGATEEWVLLLRTLATARVLVNRAASVRSAVVIGGSCVGCEAAASLAMRGVPTTLISDEPILHQARFGEEAGRRIEGWLEEAGVDLVLGSAVEAIGEHSVTVPGREPLGAELILMAAGVEPRAGLAQTAEIETRDGRIVTDAQMRTSAPEVYAAGDVAFALNAGAGRRLAVEHWDDALLMGEIAGRVIAGEDVQWNVAPRFTTAIGPHALKYVGWGDGFDEARLVEHGGGAFTVWYAANGVTVGALTHGRDDDLERARELIEGA
jgi:3-phenylpropionate/trans-cinnamate dioxygenase ferredoxin reductase subunit